MQIWAWIVLALVTLSPPALKGADEWPSGQLTPRVDRPPLVGEGLGRSVLLSRIDSLTTLYHDETRADRGQLAYRIAQLYLSTGLLKHHRIALDYLESATQADSSLFGAQRLRASLAQSMKYSGQAREWYRDLCRAFPADGRAWRLLGAFHFEQGRRVLDRDEFERAATAYAHAVKVDSTDCRARLGLAASLIGLGKYDRIPQLLAPVAAENAYSQSALLMSGAAQRALGEEEQAAHDFQQALAHASPEMRETYLYGREFLDKSETIRHFAARLDPELLKQGMRQVDPRWIEARGLDLKKALGDSLVLRQALAEYWRANNPWPSHVTNMSRLEYWRRLVEAEVLFGRPEEGVAGYHRQPGVAWVRWGRPEKSMYLPPSHAGRLDDLAPFALDRNMVLPQPEIPVWVWGYRQGHYRFALVFEDLAMNGNWSAQKSTAHRMRLAERAAPLAVPASSGSEPGCRVSLASAAFYRPKGEATLESYLEIENTLPDSLVASLGRAEDAHRRSFKVEYAIFDGKQRRIDYRQRTLGPKDRRDALRGTLGLPALEEENDPWLAQFAADLKPGSYRVAVDVSGPEGEDHQSRELSLLIPERPARELSISDLELASTFEALQGESSLPSSMVKHAFGILPLPNGVYSAQESVLYVYYEIYYLCQDKQGQTRFDVAYRVYRRKDKDHSRVLTHRVVQGLSKVDPLSLSYLEETTALSPHKHVVKGGMVDISGLQRGRYVLEVAVRDRVCDQVARSYVAFSKQEGPNPGAPVE